MARQYIKWLYAGRADSLFAHSSRELQKNMGGPEAFKEITGEIITNAGTEFEVESERFVKRLGKPQYWRVARFSLLPADDLLIRLVIVDGQLAGLGLGEAHDAPPIDSSRE